jgi:hypothetical protein
MSKTVGIVPAIGGVVIASVLGFYAGTIREERVARQEILSTALAQQLEAIGVSANGLSLASENQTERLSAMLEARLAGALDRIAVLLDRGARLELPAPNLVDSVRRAARHYALVGDADRQRRSEALLASLQLGG